MASVVIPTNDNPTPPSRKVWDEAAWGNIIAIVPAFLVSWLINPLAGLGVTIAGIVGGYSYGKKSAAALKEKELREDKKTVEEPTYFNYGLSRGFVAATLIGAATTVLSLFDVPASSTIRIVGMLAGFGAMAGGSISARQDMLQEYAQARQIAEAERQKEIAVAVEKVFARHPGLAQGQQAEAAKFTQAESERRAKAQQAQPTPGDI